MTHVVVVDHADQRPLVERRARVRDPAHHRVADRAARRPGRQERVLVVERVDLTPGVRAHDRQPEVVGRVALAEAGDRQPRLGAREHARPQLERRAQRRAAASTPRRAVVVREVAARRARPPAPGGSATDRSASATRSKNALPPAVARISRPPRTRPARRAPRRARIRSRKPSTAASVASGGPRERALEPLDAGELEPRRGGDRVGHGERLLGGAAARARAAELDQHAAAAAPRPRRAPARPRPSRPGKHLESARSRSSQRDLRRATSWLASITRRAPASRITASCGTLAAVIAHAPASSWRRISAGAIEVLPCGASETRCASHQRLHQAHVVLDRALA